MHKFMTQPFAVLAQTELAENGVDPNTFFETPLWSVIAFALFAVGFVVGLWLFFSGFLRIVRRDSKGGGIRMIVGLLLGSFVLDLTLFEGFLGIFGSLWGVILETGSSIMESF